MPRGDSRVGKSHEFQQNRFQWNGNRYYQVHAFAKYHFWLHIQIPSLPLPLSSPFVPLSPSPPLNLHTIVPDILREEKNLDLLFGKTSFSHAKKDTQPSHHR